MNHKKFKNKIKWFISKLKQNDHFKSFIKMSETDFNMVLLVLEQTLIKRYKPKFKSKTSTYLIGTDYICSWSFEINEYKRTNEENATKLVFRISKRFNNKLRTLYRYHINLK